MKTVHFYRFIILNMCFVVFGLFACVLDKESDIPTGTTNERKPVFLSTSVAPFTHDSIRAKAWLSDAGVLKILHYGWVWSENPEPTLADQKIELGALNADSFDTRISGYVLGKTYHVRPYVMTATGETYGPEKTVLMSISKVYQIALVADSACLIRVRSNIQGVQPVPVDYGLIYLVGPGIPTFQNKDGIVHASGINGGSFQADLTMLIPDTLYSVRAFDKTMAGIGYSEVLQVTTPPSLLVAVNFSMNTDAAVFQGANVLFTNTSIGASSYSWSFGDGTTSSQTSPLHTFDTQGNLAVRLTAEQGGCALVKDTVMKVAPDPFQGYWVAIPAGMFTMGCTGSQEPDCIADEYPAHQVTLSAFFMGKTEVTQRQWKAVTGNDPSVYYSCGPDCPVEWVSWDRIVSDFIPKLDRKTGRTHRLPTEAQWEYAARGGEDTKFSGSNDLNSVGWYYDGVAYGTPHPVEQKMPNGFGLFDMSGNVWEWCNDWYDIDYYPLFPSTNPTGPATGSKRVTRGGSFRKPYIECRVGLRTSSLPGTIYLDAGFRLVRN